MLIFEVKKSNLLLYYIESKATGGDTVKNRHEGLAEMKKDGVTYCNMFWLFMFGNVLGVLLEGTWCRLIFWPLGDACPQPSGESFSLIYGVGAVMFYISGEKIRSTGYKGVVARFCSIAIVATVFELACGLLLESGMGMKAWDYSKSFMNYKGLICLKMTLLWGLAGVIFAYMVVPKLKKVFARMQGTGWKVACAALSIFMIINLSFTLVCMVRWRDRRAGIAATTQIGQYVDSKV